MSASLNYSINACKDKGIISVIILMDITLTMNTKDNTGA
jgi:hypothetical protein